MDRVLLNEPDAAVATAIRVVLEQNGFAVDLIEDPEEIRTRVLSDYAALVIDVHREKGAGLDAIRWLHHTQPDVLTRVVAITGDDAEAIRELLHHEEVCEVVIKPVSVPEILRAVEECLERNLEFAVN